MSTDANDPTKPKSPENTDDSDITDETGDVPDEPEAERTQTREGVSDLLRKALAAGVGAVFMTEEGIRRTVSDLKLPKEALGYLSAQAEKTQQEAGRILRKEIRRFLNSEAFKAQLMQSLSGLTLEIKAEVRLKPDANGKPQPDVDASAKVRVKDPKAAP